MTSIELFMSPADDGGQALEDGLDADALGSTGGLADKLAHKFREPGGDPNSLDDQGWGVIAPVGESGDRLLALIQPLIAKRTEDQGGDAPIYRVPPDMSAVEAAAWRDGTFEGNKTSAEIPGYVLILGRLDEVSLELQQVMSGVCWIGRLAFERDEQYGAYVDKLLRWERMPPVERARALFFTARDGTAATTMGHRLLIQPTVADTHALKASGALPIGEVIELGTSNPTDSGNQLLDSAGKAHPSILFSCSHGMGAPRSGWQSLDRQRAMQGALCLGQSNYISAEDVTESAFLPGGIWFFFACFGLGTPRASAYYHWLERLKSMNEFGGKLDSLLKALPKEGEQPFLAALPSTVLANPAGPLAVIGHMDLAWSYSFQDVDKASGGERHRRFQRVFGPLAKGMRVGQGLQTLLDVRSQVKTDITVALDSAASAGGEHTISTKEQIRMGHRWMLHQDLDGYMLLGDPAARLAIAPPARQRRQRASATEIASPPPVASPAPAADSSASQSTIPADRDAVRIEQAVHALLAGKQAVEALAEEYSVDRDTLERWTSVYTEAGRKALDALLQ